MLPAPGLCRDQHAGAVGDSFYAYGRSDQASMLQEVKEKRQQLEAASAQAGDPNYVARLQGAVQVLTKDAARMALHLGLLQYQLRQHDLPGLASLPAQ